MDTNDGHGRLMAEVDRILRSVPRLGTRKPRKAPLGQGTYLYRHSNTNDPLATFHRRRNRIRPTTTLNAHEYLRSCRSHDVSEFPQPHANPLWRLDHASVCVGSVAEWPPSLQHGAATTWPSPSGLCLNEQRAARARSLTGRRLEPDAPNRQDACSS